MIRSTEERPEASAITLSPEECEADFRQVLERRESMKELFRAHRTMDIDYDILIQGDRDYTDTICDFLGVSRQPMSTPTLKVLDKDRSTLVRNYDQIADYFAGTEYEKYLQSAQG